MNDTTREELAYERAETEYKRGVRAAVGIIAVLCGLCVLASLTGCEGSIGEQCRANGTCIGDKLECRFQYNSIDITMCDCHCDDAEQTAPVPKLDPETRPNVPPRMMR